HPPLCSVPTRRSSDLLERARALRAAERLTEVHRRLLGALGTPGTVLPMSDAPVRTHVRAAGTWWPLQEFLIRARGEGPPRPSGQDRKSTRLNSSHTGI